MRAIKGLFMYIGIVLGVFAAIAAVTLCIMYFVPTVRVFGIACVHYNKNISQDTINFSDYEDITRVELNINTVNVHVSIVPDKDVDGLDSELDLSVFGFSSQITEYGVISSTKVEDGVLKIVVNVTEPIGWFPSAKSTLNIKVPDNQQYDIIVSTNKANVDLGSTKSSMNLNNLTVTTGNGNLNIHNLGDGSESNTLSLNSLNLSTTKGEFDFTDIDVLNVNSLIKLNADVEGVYRFKVLNAGLDARGESIALHADAINTTQTNGFTFMSVNGYFNIKSINTPTGAENSIITENCQISIENLTGRTGIRTTYGNINITNLNSYAMLESTKGNVYVSKANDTIRITTDLGNITVDEYYRSAKFVTNKGTIKAYSKSEYSQGCTTDVISDDGNIDIRLKANPINLTTTGRAVVQIVFESVPSDIPNASTEVVSIISIGEKGSADIFFPIIYKPFKFKASGIISGYISNVAVTTSEQEQRYPTTATDEEISTSASYEFYGTITFKRLSN